MRKLLRAFPFTIAAILLLGGGIAFAARRVLTSGVSTTVTGPWPPGSPGDPMTAGKTPIGPIGIPALKPHFTERDVRAYIAQHGFPLGRTLDGKPAQISKVQFMTGAQADALLDDSTGAAPNDMVCIVWFAGPLQSSVHGPGDPHRPTPAPGQTPVPHKPQIASSGDEVFDVTTGNLLLAGLSQ